MMPFVELLSAVSRTLFITLRARVWEARQPRSLFVDSEAIRILEATADLRTEIALDRMTLVGVVIRTDIFDRQTRHHLASARPPSIVNLGAGLCTRYYRLGQPAVDWVEVDLPEVIALRRGLLPESSRHRMIGCSVTDHAWMEQIHCAPEAPPLFIAEGLLMYIDASEVRRLLIALQRRFPGCRLLADTVSPLVSLLYARHPRLGRTGIRFAWGTFESQRQLNRWSSAICFEDEWLLADHHPERWGRVALLRHVPGVRSAAKVVSLRLDSPDLHSPAGSRVVTSRATSSPPGSFWDSTPVVMTANETLTAHEVCWQVPTRQLSTKLG